MTKVSDFLTAPLLAAIFPMLFIYSGWMNQAQDVVSFILWVYITITILCILLCASIKSFPHVPASVTADLAYTICLTAVFVLRDQTCDSKEVNALRMSSTILVLVLFRSSLDAQAIVFMAALIIGSLLLHRNDSKEKFTQD